jgi:hypothetical protein
MYTPRLVRERDAYEAEKASVRTVEECNRFWRRWFQDEPWPPKSKDILAQEASKRAQAILALGRRQSRKWMQTPSPEDVDAEALYQSDIVSFELDWPLRFGKDAWHPPDSPKGMWSRRCAACGIASFDMTVANECPLCGRRLIYIWAPSDED